MENLIEPIIAALSGGIISFIVVKWQLIKEKAAKSENKVDDALVKFAENIAQAIAEKPTASAKSGGKAGGNGNPPGP